MKRSPLLLLAAALAPLCALAQPAPPAGSARPPASAPARPPSAAPAASAAPPAPSGKGPPQGAQGPLGDRPQRGPGAEKAPQGPQGPLGDPTQRGGGAEKAPQGPQGDLAQAKELFRKGLALLQSGNNELALDLFLQSRALVPGIGNTQNAALTLDRLGRFDEALVHYELLLREFSDRLSEAERREVGAAMTGLRRKVGVVDVAANVDGTLIIDGRKRGELPLAAPIRVMPGSHTVRVLKDGYAPAETVINVKVGEEKAVDLRLDVLTSSGRLRISDEAEAPEAEVLIDGAPLGKAPWEGTLGVGRHVVALRAKEAGTAPSVASVIAGQTVELRLRSVPIGPPLRIDPSPLTASVFVDDVALGQGPWEGRLPLGGHQVRVVEEGYQTRSVPLDGTSRGTLLVELPIDEDHPRWRRAQTAKLLVEAHGGYGLGSSLGSDAEASCGGCASPGALLLGVRGAYLLPIGLAFEVGGGFLRASASFDRSVSAARAAPGQPLHSYQLDDALVLSGPYAALGLGYRRKITRSVRLAARVSLGAHFVSSSDRVTGAAVRGDQREDVFVDHSGSAVRAVNFFVTPEVGAEASFGRFHAGLGLGLALFLLDGPGSPLGDTQITDGASRCGGDPSRLACVAADASRASERPYGPFHLWIPQLHAGYTF